ncbi:MAG: helix-turn-helix domain-containing protein [Desulfobaccales bacterium]
MEPFAETFEASRVTPAAVRRFRRHIYRFFHDQGRRMPWRDTADPYHILVSEIMLQQTQVERVALKYEPFIKAFPDLLSLARAPLREIMGRWQGLGYNRRALALQRLAQRVVAEFGGRLPAAVATLRTFPGIGEATAGALAAFAFNQPVVFIETNIRRVFLHCFFPGRTGVKDREILPLVDQILDREQPRLWYYALMDYGAMLKRAAPNPNRRSAHHQRQAPFADSDRQIRGLILKTLLATPALSVEALVDTLGKSPARTTGLIHTLIQEGFLEQAGAGLRIAVGPTLDKPEGAAGG